jgi:hypothetical protein
MFIYLCHGARSVAHLHFSIIHTFLLHFIYVIRRRLRAQLYWPKCGLKEDNCKVSSISPNDLCIFEQLQLSDLICIKSVKSLILNNSLDSLYQRCPRQCMGNETSCRKSKRRYYHNGKESATKKDASSNGSSTAGGY